MKTAVRVFSVLTVLALSAIAVYAEPDWQDNLWFQICDRYGDHATCVACFNPGDGNYPVCVCKTWQDLYPNWFKAVFKNLGGCVSAFHQ